MTERKQLNLPWHCGQGVKATVTAGHIIFSGLGLGHKAKLKGHTGPGHCGIPSLIITLLFSKLYLVLLETVGDVQLLTSVNSAVNTTFHEHI